jgi:hypothetical protein
VSPDRLETRARRAPTEKSVKQEQRGLRAKSGLLVLKGCRESKAKSVRRGKQEPPGPREKLARMVPPAKPARPVLQVKRVK